MWQVTFRTRNGILVYGGYKTRTIAVRIAEMLEQDGYECVEVRPAPVADGRDELRESVAQDERDQT